MHLCWDYWSKKLPSTRFLYMWCVSGGKVLHCWPKMIFFWRYHTKRTYQGRAPFSSGTPRLWQRYGWWGGGAPDGTVIMYTCLRESDPLHDTHTHTLHPTAITHNNTSGWIVSLTYALIQLVRNAWNYIIWIIENMQDQYTFITRKSKLGISSYVFQNLTTQRQNIVLREPENFSYFPADKHISDSVRSLNFQVSTKNFWRPL